MSSRVDPLDFCFGNPECEVHLGFGTIGLLDPSERFELFLEQVRSVMIAKIRKSTEGHGLRSPQRGYGQVRAHTQSEPSIELSSKWDENRTGLRMDSQVVRFPSLADLLCIEQSLLVISPIHRLERFLRLLFIERRESRFSPLECCCRLLAGHFPYPLQTCPLDGFGPLELCALVLESLLGILDSPLRLPLDSRSIRRFGSTHDRLVLIFPRAGFAKCRLLQKQTRNLLFQVLLGLRIESSVELFQSDRPPIGTPLLVSVLRFEHLRSISFDGLVQRRFTMGPEVAFVFHRIVMHCACIDPLSHFGPRRRFGPSGLQ